MAPERSHTGLELYNRYQIGALAAEGALCAVYRGQDTVLRRPIAIKVVPPDLADAYREALHACSALSHPAIVATFDAITHDDWLYLVQEFVTGRPLSSYVEAGLPSARAVDIAGQIARVLAYAHAHEVVHGDLTAAAVLVDRRAVVRLNNFGLPPDAGYFQALEAVLASALDAMPGDARMEAGAAPGVRGDIRALGLILWQVLTAPVPAEPGASEGMAGGRAFRADVPEQVRALARRALQPGSAEGFDDAESLAIAFETLGRELAAERGLASEETPPALRAARTAVARDAAWSAEETLGVLRAWVPGAGRNSGPAGDSAPTEPARAPGRRTAGPRATGGPSRLSLPSRPLGEHGSQQQQHPPGLRPRTTAAPTPSQLPTRQLGASPWLGQPQAMARSQPGSVEPAASINVRALLLVSMALFLLFFLIGFITQPAIGIR